MPKLISLLILLLSLLLSPVANSSTTPLRSTLLANEALLQDNTYDLLVVEILNISNIGHTNANPPTAQVRIHQILRGAPKVKKELSAIWQGVPKQQDITNQKLRDTWYAEPLQGPEVGTILLVFAQNADGDVLILQADRAYEFTDRNRTTAIQNLANSSEKIKIQNVLYWLILFLPFGALALLIYAERLSSETKQFRIFLRTVSQLTCLIAFVVYWQYEQNHKNPDALMRTDLLLILPSLAIVLGILIFSTRTKK